MLVKYYVGPADEQEMEHVESYLYVYHFSCTLYLLIGCLAEEDFNRGINAIYVASAFDIATDMLSKFVLIVSTLSYANEESHDTSCSSDPWDTNIN